MAGFSPAIYDFSCVFNCKSWMAGTRPAMTVKKVERGSLLVCNNEWGRRYNKKAADRSTAFSNCCSLLVIRFSL